MSVFYADNDIRNILASLPTDETEHMRRVGLFVNILAGKISRTGRYTSIPVGADGMDLTHAFGEAASYHDIGKAFVPPGLLTKPGKLSKEETAVMRMHPEYARRLFAKLKSCEGTGIPDALIDLAFDSAIYHHEWWNGQGYPYGISYGKIPIIARITSICDAYDAITSKRVYINAHSHEYAHREIRSHAGTQFDPLLVDLFSDLEEDFATLQKQMAVI